MRIVSAKLGRCGLGNKLFMMAACYGYAKKYDLTPMIHSKSCEIGPHSAERYEDTVFGAFGKTDLLPDYIITEKYEQCLSYYEIATPPSQAQHIQLSGYFQNEQYLGEGASKFIRNLEMPITSLLNNVCFIHVRRLNYHSSKRHGLDLESYYKNAIKYVSDLCKQVSFLLFSDDLSWCKSHPLFMRDDIDFCEESNEVKTLAIMSQCEIGGICANSSFSWWGAYLNKQERQSPAIFVMPKRWVNDPIVTDIAFKGAWIIDI